MESENILLRVNLMNKQFENNNNSINAIKSNLMFRYMTLAKQQKKNIDFGQVCCNWCFNTWFPGMYRVMLKPENHPKRHVRSLLKKDFSTLNKYQQQLVSKIKKSMKGNTLIMKCLICMKNTYKLLKKESEPLKDEGEVNTSNLLIKRKRKKKKKDLFAGLNAHVVKTYKNSVTSEAPSKSKPASHLSKKPAKLISFKQQLQIHRALLQTQPQKKQPSLLSKFLDNL